MTICSRKIDHCFPYCFLNFCNLIIPKQGIEMQFFFLNGSWRFLKNGHHPVKLHSSAPPPPQSDIIIKTVTDPEILPLPNDDRLPYSDVWSGFSVVAETARNCKLAGSSRKQFFFGIITNFSTNLLFACHVTLTIYRQSI